MSMVSFSQLVRTASFQILSSSGFLAAVVSVAMMGGVALSQTPLPITPSGLRTQVNVSSIPPTGNVQYDVTGGTRPGAGTNLFHSFGDFNVPTNNIANFLNKGSFDLNGTLLADGLATNNILARVTNPNPSSIFGTIQTTGFGNANLFLMNPAGIVFGPNATLNVGGSVAFTAANNLRLGDAGGTSAGIFHADTGLTNVLTSAPVTAFGFLRTNTAGISVQGSTLSVQPGSSISLVGGNKGFTYTNPDTVAIASVPDGITMTGGKLSAPSGQINIASVASAGEVSARDFMPTSGTTMGVINLSQGAMLNVSGNASGTVRIRGGKLEISDATLTADTVDAAAAPIAIDINVTGDLSITDTRGVPTITARTTGTGDAGEVQIQSDNFTATTSKPSLFSPTDSHFAFIDTHTSGSGKAGNVTLEMTNNLSATGQSTGPLFFIDSGTVGVDGGHGGDVSIAANAVRLQNANISTGDFIATSSGQDSAGSGGNVMITADTLSMTRSIIATDGFWAGRAGDLTLNIRNIEMKTFSALSLLEFEGGGKLAINADRLIADSAQFDSETVFGPGGGFTITAKVVELKNGTTLRSQTVGDGNAGDIRITATDQLTLSDDPTTLGSFTRPTGLFTNSLGDAGLGNMGNAGAIILTSPRIEISGGARINTTTQSSGHGGNIVVTTTNQITMSGERPSEVIEEFHFGLGSTRASGIYARTIGGEFCSGSCGDAGNVTITTGSLNLASGAVIDSGTANNGRGGNISIHATNTSTLSGTMADGTASGIFSRTIGATPDAGSGGNIALTAGQSVTISDGASVSASSTGPGNAGNISINAGQHFDMLNSSVKTEASQASGGNIDVRAIDRVRLVNSTISTSVLGGSGTGGNITIDPNVVVLQNSQVIAQAVQGAGGNITITTPLFLADSNSLVSASSQFGLNGTVTIQSPTSNLSGSLGTLATKPRQAQSLLTQRCAALANGQASSFVVAGREQLPADPGGWLTSPLAFASLDESLIAGDAVGSLPTITAMPTHDDGTVSLRRFTPAGFLMANYADSEATGCHS